MKKISNSVLLLLTLCFLYSCSEEPTFETGKQLDKPFTLISFPEHDGFEPFYGEFEPTESIVVPVQLTGMIVPEVSVTLENNSIGLELATVQIDDDGRGVLTTTAGALGWMEDGDVSEFELWFEASDGTQVTRKIFYVLIEE